MMWWRRPSSDAAWPEPDEAAPHPARGHRARCAAVAIAAACLISPPVGRPAEAVAKDGRKPGAPPTARFYAIAAFDSLDIVGPGAWSPRGERLALRCWTSALYVWDARRPSRQPLQVLRAAEAIHSVSWSPDGSWLVAWVAGAEPQARTAIIAARATGGAEVVMSEEAGIRGAAWGPDGRIYAWIGRRHRAMDPPAAWRPPAGLRLAPPPVLEVADDLSLRLRHWAPAPGEEPLLAGADLRAAVGTRATLMDLLPDGSRYLIGLSRDTTATWLVVDADGRTVSDLRRSGLSFQPTSLSSDGRLVVGFSGRWGRDAGWVGTGLRVADAGGAWVIPVAGTGEAMAPQLSRSGGFIAFSDRERGGTSVGRMVLGSR